MNQHTSEPIHILSLGAGVQSSCMALMAARGEISPMPEAAIFADVGDDPKAVYDYLDYLKGLLPFPVIVVSKGKLSEMSTRVRTSGKTGQTYTKPAIPAFMLRANGGLGMMQRQCTLTMKIEPVRSMAKKLAGRGRSIVTWLGISTDEVIRMKPSRDKRITHRWPLIEAGVSRKACLAWMAERGYKTPPRSACVYCPYHSNAEWMRIKTDQPEDFAAAVDYERRLQGAYAACPRLDGTPFLHASRKPLAEVDFDDRTTQGELWGAECEGMCGV
jgi:hypothetical protein